MATPNSSRSLVTMVFEPVAGQREAIALDVSKRENHEGQVDLTDNPLETGATVTDHVHFKPQAFRVDGVIVDFPLKTALAPTVGAALPGFAGRTSEIYERLLQLQSLGTLFEVHSRVRVYRNMILQSVGGVREAGNMLSLSLAFREVRFADSQTVPIKPTKIHKMKPKQDAGPQTPAVATTPETDKSFLSSIADSITVSLGGLPESFKKAPVK